MDSEGRSRPPPNGCSRCGGLERGHGQEHAYAAPNDALRLARMRARREARPNPAPRPARSSPDTILTLTANTGDWEDASRYLLHQLRGPRMRRSSLTLNPTRPPETASERVEALLAHGGYVMAAAPTPEEFEAAKRAVLETALELADEQQTPPGHIPTALPGGEYTPEHRYVWRAYRRAHNLPTVAGEPTTPTAVQINQAVTWWNQRQEGQRG